MGFQGLELDYDEVIGQSEQDFIFAFRQGLLGVQYEINNTIDMINGTIGTTVSNSTSTVSDIYLCEDLGFLSLFERVMED